jgi:ABC-type transport system substrate-binding protein
MREMAKPAGFRINVQTMPHATYLDQVWKKGSFYVGFYNMQATADAIFSLLYTSIPPGTRRAGTTPSSTSWSRGRVTATTPSAAACTTRRRS